MIKFNHLDIENLQTIWNSYQYISFERKQSSLDCAYQRLGKTHCYTVARKPGMPEKWKRTDYSTKWKGYEMYCITTENWQTPTNVINENIDWYTVCARNPFTIFKINHTKSKKDRNAWLSANVRRRFGVFICEIVVEPIDYTFWWCSLTLGTSTPRFDPFGFFTLEIFKGTDWKIL